MKITEIKQQLSITKVLSRYNLKPNKNGLIKCPFHNDKTPSMQVYEKTGTYHWFESRYKTAWAHTKLGNNHKACEILTITLVLHPDFGDDELKQKFIGLKNKLCKEEQSEH